MPELKPKTTTAAAEDVAIAFKAAAEAAGLEVTPQLLAVLLAQSALETGHWSAMYNFNFGNVKATDKWISGGGSYTFYDKKPAHAEAPVTENLSADAVKYWLARAEPRTDGGEGLDMVVGHPQSDGRFYCLFWPSHVQARFRAFDDLEAGAAAFLQKLTGRYKPALKPAARGDVAGYVNLIHSLGPYFTASIDDWTDSKGRKRLGYRSQVQSLYRKYLHVARAAMAGPFDHLPDAGRLVSDPADCVMHSAGLLELSTGARIAKLAVWDEKNQTFARLEEDDRRTWLNAHGMRLATPAELEERHRRAVHVKFRARVFTAADAKHMASPKWCAEADADLLADAVEAGWDGTQAIDNPKTWCEPWGAIIGLWRHAGDDPAKDQQLSLYHANDPLFGDYATLLVPAVNDGATDPAPDSIDTSGLDPDLSHGERTVAWALARVGTAEQPLGSNRGPEVSAWLKPSQRDGYGPEFGQWLASSGANWCAAFSCAAQTATRLPADPPAVHAYRCSGIELENDAKAAEAWREIAEVLAGTWLPRAGDIAIYKSGSQAWRRHVVLVVEAEGPESFRGIGGNEGNKVTDAGGRRFDAPQLLGFVELPRVNQALHAAGLQDWSHLRRAVELEQQLWQGVVGMDAFDKLLAELQEADPRDDGEEVLC